MSNPEHESWSTESILEIAKRQKQLLWIILLSLIAMFFFPALLLVGIIQIYFTYKLAQAVRSSAAWIYIILAFIPLIGLLALLHLSGKATKALRSNGINVGLMGAKTEDLKQLTSCADTEL